MLVAVLLVLPLRVPNHASLCAEMMIANDRLERFMKTFPFTHCQPRTQGSSSDSSSELSKSPRRQRELAFLIGIQLTVDLIADPPQVISDFDRWMHWMPDVTSARLNTVHCEMWRKIMYVLEALGMRQNSKSPASAFEMLW